MIRKTLLATMAAFALTGSAQAANLVVNGEFEQNTLNLPAQQAALNAATVSGNAVGVEIDTHFGYAGVVTGWSSPSTGSDYNLYFFDNATATSGDAASRYPGEQQRPNSNFVARAGGGAFMVLDADPGFSGPLQQTVNGLTVGQQYELSFWWAAGELSNRQGYTFSQLTGSFGGDAFATNPFFNSHPFNAPGFANQTGDFSGWQQVSFNFTAHTTSQLLSFLAVGAPAANLPPVAFLDGVSVRAVPEPAVWGLMLMGFGGLGVVARRRRAVAA
jgi:hypothetical protein